MNSTKPACTRMLQMRLPAKSATAQLRHRNRSNTGIMHGPLIGPPSGPIVNKKPPIQPVIPLIPMVPVSIARRGSTVERENHHEKEVHYHQQFDFVSFHKINDIFSGGYKRACHVLIITTQAR